MKSTNYFDGLPSSKLQQRLVFTQNFTSLILTSLFFFFNTRILPGEIITSGRVLPGVVMVLLRSKINWYLCVYIHLKPHNVTAGLTYVCAEFLTETETSTLEVPLPLPQHTISFPFSVQRMKKCTAIIIYSEFNRWMDSVKYLNLAGFFGMVFLPHTVPLPTHPTPHPPPPPKKN